MPNNNQVEIEILMRDEVTKILKQIEENTKKTTKTMQTEGKKSTSAFDNIKNAVNSLSLVTTLGMGAAGVAVVNFGKESVESFLKAERVSNQFSLVFGKTSESLIKNLKEIGDGTVSTTNLMQSSIRAAQLGINQAAIPQLFEVARAKAKLMGIDSTQAFNDMTIGIGRQSKMILDNLGIILNLEKAYKSFADTHELVVESLTDSEKKMAIVNSIMNESQGILLLQATTMGDHLESVERLKIGWEEFKISSGDAIVSTYDTLKELSLGMVNADTDLYKLAKQTVPEGANEFQKLSKEVEITAAKINLIGTPEQKTKLDEYKQTVLNLDTEIQTLKQSLDGVRTSLLNIGSAPTFKELTISEDLQKAKNRVNELTLANFDVMESGIGMNEVYRQNAKEIEKITNGAIKRGELELEYQQGLRTAQTISGKVSEAQSEGTTTPFDVAEIEVKRLALEQQLIDLPISIELAKQKLNETSVIFTNIGDSISEEKIELGNMITNIKAIRAGLILLQTGPAGLNIFKELSSSDDEFKKTLEKNLDAELTSLDSRLLKLKEIKEVTEAIATATSLFSTKIMSLGAEVE